MSLKIWFYEQVDRALTPIKTSLKIPIIRNDNPEIFMRVTGTDYEHIAQILAKNIRWLGSIEMRIFKATGEHWSISFKQDPTDIRNSFEINFENGQRAAFYLNLYPRLRYEGDGAIFLRNVLRACQEMNIDTLAFCPESQQAQKFFEKAGARHEAWHFYMNESEHPPAPWPFKHGKRYMSYNLKDEIQMTAAMGYLEERSALSIARKPRPQRRPHPDAKPYI